MNLFKSLRKVTAASLGLLSGCVAKVQDYFCGGIEDYDAFSYLSSHNESFRLYVIKQSKLITCSDNGPIFSSITNVITALSNGTICTASQTNTTVTTTAAEGFGTIFRGTKKGEMFCGDVAVLAYDKFDPECIRQALYFLQTFSRSENQCNLGQASKYIVGVTAGVLGICLLAIAGRGLYKKYVCSPDPSLPPPEAVPLTHTQYGAAVSQAR